VRPSRRSWLMPAASCPHTQAGSAQFYSQALAEPRAKSDDGRLDAADAIRLAPGAVGGGKPAGSDTGLDNVLVGALGSLAGDASRKRAGSDDLVSAGLAFLASPQGQQLVAGLLQSLTAGEHKQPAPHRAESGRADCRHADAGNWGACFEAVATRAHRGSSLDWNAKGRSRLGTALVDRPAAP